jgi:site-specific recombinase XerD
MTDVLGPLTPALGREVGNALGVVADDWHAAEVWLQAIANRPRRNSPLTVAAYRQHLAKLRWYCENVSMNLPSKWTVQDVDTFYRFLKELPEYALCERDYAGRYAELGEAGYTPFRCVPSASSRSDIQKCVHALFRAWREVGYIHANPMGFHGAGTERKINANRALSLDLFDLVLETMEEQPKDTFEARQRHVRDRFLLMALRELGLRSSELVKATMGAFRPLSDPRSGRTYWIMHVTMETAKGGLERKIPVTRQVFEALVAYRESFGLPALPAPADMTPLLLSPRTQRNATTARGVPLKSVSTRRDFGKWRAITSRHGLYYVVKQRLSAAAMFLESVGDHDRKAQLEQASPHWLRHTFAKAALMQGEDMRSVAAWLGHRDIGTTMLYTEQEALDLIRQTEQVRPDVLAVEEQWSPPR